MPKKKTTESKQKDDVVELMRSFEIVRKRNVELERQIKPKNEEIKRLEIENNDLSISLNFFRGKIEGLEAAIRCLNLKGSE